MSVYLITGATSDVGYELIKTVATEGDKFLLQGFGDGEALKNFCEEKERKKRRNFVELDERKMSFIAFL